MEVTRIHSGSIVQRDRNILFSKLDDELLAIDGQGGYCYSLNESAGRAWALISTPMVVEDVCAQLRREYDVDEETCERAVIELFQDLCEAGLVSLGNAA
jgi:hypothetical protein